jgi:hypothetical protein
MALQDTNRPPHVEKVARASVWPAAYLIEEKAK